VQTETPGEQTVSEGNLHVVVRSQPAGDQEAGAEIRPGVQVRGRVGDKGRLAGGAGRAVDANDLVAGHGQEAERVVLPQILLGGKRQAAKIVQGAYRIGRHALPGESLLVERHARNEPHAVLEPLKLQLAEFVARHRLGRIPDAILDSEVCHCHHCPCRRCPVRDDRADARLPHEIRPRGVPGRPGGYTFACS